MPVQAAIGESRREAVERRVLLASNEVEGAIVSYARLHHVQERRMTKRANIVRGGSGREWAGGGDVESGTGRRKHKTTPVRAILEITCIRKRVAYGRGRRQRYFVLRGDHNTWVRFPR